MYLRTKNCVTWQGKLLLIVFECNTLLVVNYLRCIVQNEYYRKTHGAKAFIRHVWCFNCIWRVACYISRRLGKYPSSAQFDDRSPHHPHQAKRGDLWAEGSSLIRRRYFRVTFRPDSAQAVQPSISAILS